MSALLEAQDSLQGTVVATAYSFLWLLRLLTQLPENQSATFANNSTNNTMNEDFVIPNITLQDSIQNKGSNGYSFLIYQDPATTYINWMYANSDDFSGSAHFNTPNVSNYLRFYFL